MMHLLTPPKSWDDSALHLSQIILHPYYRSLAEVRHHLHHAIENFFRKAGLKALDLPLTTNSVSSPIGLGSDSKPVRVEILGCPTFLADSMQFLLELGCRIFDSGTSYNMISFRGEETDAFHLAQFHHAECELPGVLEDIIATGGDIVHYLAEHLINECPDAVRSIAGSCDHLEALLERAGTFPQIRSDDAVRELKKMGESYLTAYSGFELPNRLGEAKLNEVFGQGLAIWVTHFPHLAVPFYQAFDPTNTQVALNADLVLGDCETIGAGQRHGTTAEVRAALHLHQVEKDSYEWYIRMKEVKPLQTCGLGLGVERFLMWALRQSDIRNCALVFRENGRTRIP
jgi:asparaginyl-tRNA synthetase